MSLTAKKLRRLVSYNPRTGVFIRLVRTSNAINVGDVAGHNHKSGYLNFSIDGTRYLSHRLAFLYMTGAWPKGDVDHRDGNRKNNKWKNLRDGTSRLNAENQRRAKKGNQSGMLGVSPHLKKFKAVIASNGVTYYLGLFPTAKLAHLAYLKKKRQLHRGCTL